MEPQPKQRTQDSSKDIEDGSLSLPEDIESQSNSQSPSNTILGKRDESLAAVHAVSTASSEPAPIYSIYTSRQKTLIVIIASLASLFSPLSANIYYPALEILADDLHVSASNINLSVTTYLVRVSMRGQHLMIQQDYLTCYRYFKALLRLLSELLLMKLAVVRLI